MTFDTGRFTMERIEMTNKIRAIRDKYEVTPVEFSALLSAIHDMSNEVENSAWACEDVLFEIYVRIIKEQEITKWIAQKMITDFLQDITDYQDPKYKQVIASIKNVDNTTGVPHLFKIYQDVYNNVKNEDAPPSFSAISALKEMCDEAMGPPGGQ